MATKQHAADIGKHGTGGATAAVIGAAAAGLAAGLIANISRKVAIQAPSALAGDWFDAVKGEHKAALLLFDVLGATTDKQTTKRAFVLMQLKHALSKHAFTEENVLYPALRDAGDVEDADKLNHEHGYVKQYLHTLTDLPKDSPRFLRVLADFRRDIEEHIRDEEDTIFPPLHAKLTAEKNKEITAAANKEGFKLA